MKFLDRKNEELALGLIEAARALCKSGQAKKLSEGIKKAAETLGRSDRVVVRARQILEAM